MEVISKKSTFMTLINFFWRISLHRQYCMTASLILVAIYSGEMFFSDKEQNTKQRSTGSPGSVPWTHDENEEEIKFTSSICITPDKWKQPDSATVVWTNSATWSRILKHVISQLESGYFSLRNAALLAQLIHIWYPITVKLALDLLYITHVYTIKWFRNVLIRDINKYEYILRI